MGFGWKLREILVKNFRDFFLLFLGGVVGKDAVFLSLNWVMSGMRS